MKVKKLLAGMLSAAMVLSTMVVPAFAEDTASTELITEISTPEQLKEFADNVNSGETYQGKTVTLANDIDLNNENWKPIGIDTIEIKDSNGNPKKTGTKFMGTFDGQEHTISNLLINRANGYGNGLFANTVGATIKNFTIDGAYVCGYEDSYWGNVYGIVAGYSYGTAAFENITVKNAKIYGYGKIGVILGMAGEPSGVTTIKDCRVENTKIYGVYDVAPFIGLSQNAVAFENNTSENVEWVPASNEKYVELNDAVVKNGETYNVRGLRWLYRGRDEDTGKYYSYLYNGYADCYTDFVLGYNPYSLVYDDQYILCDGFTHNEYEAKIGDVLYDNADDAFKNAVAGDVIETKYFTPIKADTENLSAELAGIISKNECRVVDINSAITNDNNTDDEKLEVINAANFDKTSDETVNNVLEAIKGLPTDKKEEVSASSIDSIINKNASAIIAHDDETNPTITAKSVASNVRTLSVTQLPESETLQQPDSVDALYFDITLKDDMDNEIKEVDIPLFVTVKVGNTADIKKVLRHHDGVTSEVAYEIIDDTTIGLTIAKFSDFAVVMNQNVGTNQAVLGLEEIQTDEEYTAKYRLYICADDYSIISNFESGEFAFSMTGESSAEFTAESGMEIVYEANANKYRINRTAEAATTRPGLVGKNGKMYIYLATLTLTGAGKGSIDLSDIKMYKKSGTDSLVIDIDALASATTSYEIKPATQNLVIKVAYPNNIVNNKTDYQDMTVTVKGADFNESYKLGSDASSNVVWNDADNSYTVTVADKLAKNTAYSVEVSGAGYRTARYTVTLSGDKTLNFWNNAKDSDAFVEEGNTASAKKVTFLAGDIVKDNDINIYDLSAVVSYFGTDNLVENHKEYAKYDLNRDGKIDSKDVAYVLVSWGK